MNLQLSTTRLARQAASFGLALGLTLVAAASQAAVARFDTTSFGYTVSAGSLNWSEPAAYQALNTEAYAGGGALGDDAQSNYPSAWTSGSVSALTGYSGATASANGQTLQGAADATRTSLAPADLAAHTSRAYANQSGVYSLTEDGTVTFTVGWQIQVEGASTDPYSNIANAFMSFTAGLYDYSFTDRFSEELFSFDVVNGVTTASGIWTISVAMLAGQQGFYDLTGTANAEADAAYTASAVPEPGSIALLAAGLGTLWTVRRRRSTKA